MARAKKVKDLFLIGWSECGKVDQIELHDSTHGSLKAAQDYANERIEAGELDGDLHYFVVQVVCAGKAKSSVRWE